MSTQETAALIKSVNNLTATVAGKMGDINNELAKIPALVKREIDLVLTLGPHDGESIAGLYRKHAAAGRKVTIQLQSGIYLVPERVIVNASSRLELKGLSSNRENVILQVNPTGNNGGIAGVWSGSGIECKDITIDSLTPNRLQYLEIGSNQAYYLNCLIRGISTAGESTYGFNSYHFHSCEIQGAGGHFIVSDNTRSKSSVNNQFSTISGFHADSIYNGIVE